MLHPKLLERFRVEPGKKFRLRDHDPAWAGGDDVKGLDKAERKERAVALLDQSREALDDAQGRLYADNRYAILVVLQAMDAAGKDGTIKHVMSGLNPQGCAVYSFKKPTPEELDHDFLWRCNRCLPERGKIGIFNRSYYEEVLVVKVHPELLDRQKLPPGKRGNAFWKARYESINDFEQHLTRNGTLLLKFFLNVSKEEQKRRFLERLERPEKHWKFSAADLAERQHWDDYLDAYQEALEATSTDWAPWYVIPADHKWVTRAAVAGILTSTLHSLDLRYPELDEEQQRRLAAAKAQLEQEK